jgi:hypothetical protein
MNALVTHKKLQPDEYDSEVNTFANKPTIRFDNALKPRIQDSIAFNLIIFLLNFFKGPERVKPFLFC